MSHNHSTTDAPAPGRPGQGGLGRGFFQEGVEVADLPDASLMLRFLMDSAISVMPAHDNDWPSDMTGLLGRCYVEEHMWRHSSVLPVTFDDRPSYTTFCMDRLIEAYNSRAKLARRALIFVLPGHANERSIVFSKRRPE